MSDPAHLASAGEIAAAGYAAWNGLLASLLPSEGQGRLLIVPTPSLASLPFEALATEAAPGATDFSSIHFVIDRYQVSYGPSVPVLSLLASVPKRSGEPRLLVLADALVPGETAAVCARAETVDGEHVVGAVAGNSEPRRWPSWTCCPGP
jgi:hypothetical protein